MTHTLSSQIRAIQEARTWIKGTCANEREFKVAIELDSILNDAGSSLAALNLNHDREGRIKQLEEGLTLLIGLLKENNHQLWLNDPEWAIIDKAKELLNPKP